MRRLLALALAAACCFATPASSDYVIDQDQPSGPVYMAHFAQTGLAQSFMHTYPIISGAGILLQAGVGSSDNVTIELWTLLPNQDGAEMLATGSALGTQGQWVDVYWDDVIISPMATYYLVFTGNMTLGIAGDTDNPYPFGCVYANWNYMEFPTFDYAFRTWYWRIVSPTRDQTWSEVKALY